MNLKRNFFSIEKNKKIAEEKKNIAVIEIFSYKVNQSEIKN